MNVRGAGSGVEPPSVVVRPMAPEDVDEALDLFAEVAAEGRWMGTEAGFDRVARRESWLASVTDPRARVVVVTDPSGVQLGSGWLHLARYGVAELGMALAAPARGRGLGGVLLDSLLVAADQLGAHKVELQVWPHNSPAIRLYLSRGFVVEGRIRAHYRRSSGQLWDAVVMGLLIDPGAAAGERGSGLPDSPYLPDTAPISP